MNYFIGILINILASVFSTLAGFNPHSQTVITFHPSFFKAFTAFASLALLRFILLVHHWVRVLGTTKYLQFAWPCQKQPCLPAGRHAQKLPCCILVKQYRVCRAGFYRAVYSGIRLHAKIYAPAFRALCFCL
jgi:hypothetical protein